MKIFNKILFVICFFIFPLASAQQFKIDQVIAVIGGKMVKLSDVENECLRSKSSGISGQMKAPKCSIFEKILEHKLF